MGTIISIFLIDRFGRRFLMLRSLPFVIFSWALVALGMGMTGSFDPAIKAAGGKIAFCGLSLFLFSFAVGMSATPWAVNAEIYPLHVIGTANSLSTTTNWISNAIVASLFLATTKTVKGEVLTYSALAAIAALGFLFIYFYVPETANKPIDVILEEIIGSQKQPETEGDEEVTIDATIMSDLKAPLLKAKKQADAK